MKRRSGFTLIELLAIIVILAIIAVITVPIILDIIERSSKGSAIDSAYGYKKAIDQYYLSKMMADNSYEVIDDEYEISVYKSDGLTVSGEEPTDGWVKVENGEVTDFSFIIGDYVVTYNAGTNSIEAVKGREPALTPKMQIKKEAKEAALEIVNNQAGTTGITDITEGWVAFINNTLKAYSVSVTVSDKTFIVTDNNVVYENNEITSNNAVAQEGTEVASKTQAEQLVVAYKVDTYVKAALTANSSLTDETAKTVSEMSGVTTNAPDSGWIHFNVDNNSVVIVDYSLTYGDLTANYQSLTDNNYVSTFGASRNKPAIIALGSPICYGPTGQQECFKIIKIFTQEGTQKAMLFADYNLKKDTTTDPVTYKQDASSPDSIRFSGSVYWMDITTIPNTLKSAYSNNGAYSYDSANYKFVDTNNTQVYPNIYDSNSNTHGYVEGYLETLKTTTYGLPSSATGRLLYYDEAYDTSMFVNDEARANGESYWLGSAQTSTKVMFVFRGGGFNNSYYDNSYGVRPVIIIPTSDL